MAPKKKSKTKNQSSSWGPKIVTGFLVLGFIGLVVNQYFKTEELLAKLHKDILNTTVADSNYSFSPGDLAFTINTKLTSTPVPGLPALTYRIYHQIGVVSHVGIIELKLSDNTILAETLDADIKMEFILDSDHVYLSNPSLLYKTLDKEVKFGNISGKLHFSGNADLQFESFDYKDRKFEVKLNRLSMAATKDEMKIKLSSGGMVFNGMEITNPELTFQAKEKILLTFKGVFKEEPIEANLVTEKKEILGEKSSLTTGVVKIPVAFIDSAFDPTLEMSFSQKEDKVRELNSEKDSLVFQVTKKPRMSAAKKAILGSFVPPKYIKRDEKYYTITLDPEQIIDDKTEKLIQHKELNTYIETWSELPQEQMIEEAFYNLVFGDHIRVLAASELVNKFDKTLGKDPLFMCLKARALIHGGSIDSHNYNNDTVMTAKDMLIEIEKAIPEHKLTTLLKLKIAQVMENDDLYNLMAQKFQTQETNPQVKAMYLSYNYQHVDHKKSLQYLDEAIKLDPTSYIVSGSFKHRAHMYEHLKDKVNMEATYKESYQAKKSGSSDLAIYTRMLVKQDRFQEALPILDDCLKVASPKGSCHAIREEAIMNLTKEKFQTSPDEALKMAKDLLFERPTGIFAHHALGWIYYQKADFKKSIEHYTISCAFGGKTACLMAGDSFNFKLNDARNAYYMYELACDLDSGNGCLKAGAKAEQFNLRDKANSFFSRSCNDLKDTGGCYQYARNLQKMNKSKEDVAVYLDKACKEIKSACQYASVVKSGKKFIIPEFP